MSETTTITLPPLSRSAATEIALALSAAAEQARLDERLDTAARIFKHAAMFYDAIGYECTANDKRRLARTCEQERSEAAMIPEGEAV
jgi:hypothetical protein